eukprot:CAMPEP_0173252180 /NCGR_PEP_ID=MMETSP1142-20121109/20574_1 /TAXON_ID=483371 /ORGANISM="non described non described, Strain CCMP2298" /LENGTH=161 /DNA_ID=CAMNT_0014185175 /DNA_START=81 /DNA_END=562 /DNA_ORIENTATION=-
MNYQVITTHLLGSTVSVRTIRQDEMAVFPHKALAQHKDSRDSGCLKIGADSLTLINISSCRVLKGTGKVWDQLGGGGEVWLLTASEWAVYSDTVLVHTLKSRHGKKLQIRNAAAMSAQQLFDMVNDSFPGIPKPPISPSPSPSPVKTPRKGKAVGVGVGVG